MNNKKLEELKKQWIETAQEKAKNDYEATHMDDWYEEGEYEFWDWQEATDDNLVYGMQVNAELDDLTDQIKAIAPNFDFDELDAQVDYLDDDY